MAAGTPTTASLRALAGMLGCRASTSTSTNRGIPSLTGAIAESDVDVQTVVNALVEAVDVMPEETVTRGNTSVTTDIFSHQMAASTTETAWSLDIGSGVSAAYQITANVTAVSDDGIEFASYVIIYSVYWNGVTATQMAAPTAAVTEETSPASSAATMDVSGTTIRLRVGVTADWRFGGHLTVVKVAL